jgi:hypothetical protein
MKKYPEHQDKPASLWVKGQDENVGLTSFANMPAQAVIQEFPRSRQLRGSYMDDTIGHIDTIDDLSEGRELRRM